MENIKIISTQNLTPIKKRLKISDSIEPKINKIAEVNYQSNRNNKQFEKKFSELIDSTKVKTKKRKRDSDSITSNSDFSKVKTKKRKRIIISFNTNSNKIKTRKRKHNSISLNTDSKVKTINKELIKIKLDKELYEIPESKFYAKLFMDCEKYVIDIYNALYEYTNDLNNKFFNNIRIGGNNEEDNKNNILWNLNYGIPDSIHDFGSNRNKIFPQYRNKYNLFLKYLYKIFEIYNNDEYIKDILKLYYKTQNFEKKLNTIF